MVRHDRESLLIRLLLHYYQITRQTDEITTRGQLRTNAGVNRYMACLSSVFNIAVREWQWLEENQ